MRIFNFLKSNNDKHKSLRVKTNIGDKYINVELGQTYESLDILSLRIFQKDLYRLFDSDYGVIVGRVTGSGVGLPNCRVSVFIPIDETEVDSPITLEDIKKIETLSLYPYQTTFDTDDNGKVFNLLPKYSRNRNFNDFPDNEFGIGATPKTPVGTFPEKEEVLVNETLAYVYDKYLKFTTITNDSGDYILTVPANRTYTVTMCADITDIGQFSTTPALLKLEGYPDSFFVDEGTRINDQLPLETLPNIDIQNITQYVKPLWSQDETNTNVGINRLDFKLNKKIKPFVTVFGNYFTPGNRSWWGDRIILRLYFAWLNLCLGNCDTNATLAPNRNFGIFVRVRVAIRIFGRSFGVTFGPGSNIINQSDPGDNDIKICIQIRNIIPFIRFRILQDLYCTLNGGRNDYDAFQIIYYGGLSQCNFTEQNFLESIPDDLFVQKHIKGNLVPKVFTIKNTVDDLTADLLNDDNLPPSDAIYTQYSYDDDIGYVEPRDYVFYQNNGSFIALINCDRNKVVTNENGDLVPVDANSPTGVFVGYRGYFYLKNDATIDNPPSRNRTGKIALKIPQSLDYGPTYPNNNFLGVPTSNPQFPNQIKWIWKHYKFEAGKIYSVAQYIGVRKADMTIENEQKENLDDTPSIDLLFGYLFDNPNNSSQGFEEQTNIIYFGSKDVQYTSNITNPAGTSTQYLNNNSVAYKRDDNNVSDTKYVDMYNHITIPGRDPDPATQANSAISTTNPNNIPSNNNPPPPIPPPPVLILLNGSTTKFLQNYNNINNSNTIYVQRAVKFDKNVTVTNTYYTGTTSNPVNLLVNSISSATYGPLYDEVKYNEYYTKIRFQIDNLSQNNLGDMNSNIQYFSFRLYASEVVNGGGIGNSQGFLVGPTGSLNNNNYPNYTATVPNSNQIDLEIKWDWDTANNFFDVYCNFGLNGNSAQVLLNGATLYSNVSSTKNIYRKRINTNGDLDIFWTHPQTGQISNNDFSYIFISELYIEENINTTTINILV